MKTILKYVATIVAILFVFIVPVSFMLGGCATADSAKYVDFASRMRVASKTEGRHVIPGPITGKAWTVTTSRVEGDTVGSAYPWVFVSRIEAPDIELTTPGH